MANIRPMLAAKFKDEKPEDRIPKMRFPVLCSPKIDGIRWMKPANDLAQSRSWTPLPNKNLQRFMREEPLLDWLDGEVVVGHDPTIPGIFNKSQSCIMSANNTQEFSLWVFDNWLNPQQPFFQRTGTAKSSVDYIRGVYGKIAVNYVEHRLAQNAEEVFELERKALEAGFEGLMLRDPEGHYKYGRSTLREQGLVALKRFEDAEAQVIGFEPLERNLNEQVRNPFGLAKRSSHRAGKVADNLLGRLLVRSERYGDFAIGSGFDEETRRTIWENQETYQGKWVTFKYQGHGTLDKPRMPIFRGFRSEIDL